MDRKGLMLAALAAGGENATFSPVQIQKLFFLIDREAAQLVGGPYFSFEPYDYGPFDRAVYDQLDLLELCGSVKATNGERYRVYSLTPQGYAEGVERLADIGPEASSYIKKVANWVRALSFQQLVAAIYKRYPDMKVNSVFH